MITLENTDELIQYFIDVIEAKDPYTQGHSLHVKAVADAIIDCLPGSYQLDKDKILKAALLHDIGKIRTPDSILNKDGALNDEEWLIMNRHPLEGREIIRNTWFAELGNWIYYHHERIDGRGYYGLKGDEIPLEARIIAIADTFSALRTYRIYRPAKSVTDTINIMREAGGTQSDAEILGHFLSVDINVLENLECNCEICKLRRMALQEK